LFIYYRATKKNVVYLYNGTQFSKNCTKDAKNNQTWPPIVANCPDYWEDTTNNGEGCYNKLGLGKCNLPTYDNKNVMNFNVTPYNGAEGSCAKAKWAKECGVTWDGMSQTKCT